MIVAIIAGTFPSGKKNITGIKYTNVGMVCIASKIGRMMTENVLLNAINIPTGIPIARDNTTDISIIATVVIVSSHKLKDPIKKIKAANISPFNMLFKYQPSRKTIIMMTHQGVASKADSIVRIVVEAIVKMKSNNHPKFIARKSINFST